MMNVDKREIALVKFLARPGIEGFRREAYLCPAGRPTIGYGSTTYPDGSKVMMGDVITRESAEMCCLAYIQKNVTPFLKSLEGDDPFSEDVFIALGSLEYNIPHTKWSQNLISDIRNRQWEKVITRLLLYVNVNGVKSAGLQKRREKEAQLIREGAKHAD